MKGACIYPTTVRYYCLRACIPSLPGYYIQRGAHLTGTYGASLSQTANACVLTASLAQQAGVGILIVLPYLR
jgi:hypothetical protein